MNLLAVLVGGSRMSIFGDRMETTGTQASHIILALKEIDPVVPI